MVGDGNCGFRAVAHAIYGAESSWCRVRRELSIFLDNIPPSQAAGFLRDFEAYNGVKLSLRGLQESLEHFAGHCWDLTKWFSNDKHAQLTADAYNVGVVMITYRNSKIVVRAPSSLQSVEGIRAAIPTIKLVGMVFSGCGDGGHWDYVNIEEARELLVQHAEIQVSRVSE